MNAEQCPVIAAALQRCGLDPNLKAVFDAAISSLEGREVDSTGRISSPGKFEAELWYAPYWYDQTLDGCSDSVRYLGQECEKMSISPEERKVFGLKSRKVIYVHESEQGFVYVY